MINQEILNQLIKSFHLSVTYLKIYPPTSQMVSVTLDTLYKSFLSITSGNKNITFSDISGKLLIDGTEAQNREVQLIANNIIKLMNQKKIQSITFKSGITKDEIVNFINDIIKKKREEMPEYLHIALDQTVYVAMVKGEEVVVKISESIQKGGGDIVNLLKSVRESYDMIDDIPDTNVKNQVQDHLAQELSKQDPSTLKDIFDRELPAKIEQSGLKKRLLNSLSQDKIQEIFGEIAVWYNEIRKKESSDFEAIDQLEKLKKFIQTMLQSPAAKEMPHQFFQDLIQKGLLEQLPEWFSVSPKTPATVFEVEKLLEKSSADLVDENSRQNLPNLITKLCKIENNELIEKIFEKILENLKNPAARIRLPAIQLVTSIYEILQSYMKENILQISEPHLLKTADQETSAEVQFYLMELLRFRVKQNLLHGKNTTATNIVSSMQKHMSDEFNKDPKMLSNARESFKQLISEVMEILINDIKSESEHKRLASIQILIKIGQEAIDPLIRVLKESIDIRSRKISISVLKNYGDEAIRRLGEELNLGLTAQEIKNIVEVLGDIKNNDQITTNLGTLLNFPDNSVKKEIIKYLAKQNSSQAKALIIEQLKTKDSEIISECARSLGESKTKEAIPALIALFNSVSLPYELQEEICIVFSNIEDSRVVPALISKLNKKPFFFSRKSTEIDRVRMRSAWALRKFVGPDIINALEKASKDKAAPIALTAKESLAIIRQKSK